MVDLPRLISVDDHRVPQRVAVRVTRDALRQIRAGHPWVFDGSITSVNREGSPGDLAVIFDEDRVFAAIGLYDPTSPLRVRILHVGKPITIDEGWFGASLDASIDRRRALIDDAETTAYRLVHGENDGWPGLIIDRYESVFVLKVYSAAWLPHLPIVGSLLNERFGSESIIVRSSRELNTELSVLSGALPVAPIVFRENGLLFEADVVRGQKTGHFLDQRENRARVRDLTIGARVLDVFACTGGFSVHAAAGGAVAVHSTDQAEAALRAAARNMARNGFEGVHETTTGDAFAVMQRMVDQHRRFDVVIVDPPSFARRATETASGMKSYHRLTQLALRLLEPGGVLVQSSCSSRISSDQFFETVSSAAQLAHRPLDVIARTGHAVDHPIGFVFGAYLKTIFAVA